VNFAVKTFRGVDVRHGVGPAGGVGGLLFIAGCPNRAVLFVVAISLLTIDI
jgi:hypothetical protein